MSPEQLVLALDTPAPTGRRTRDQAGLAKDARPGPERLLRELVRRGLAHEHLRIAAALVLALEEEATASR